MSGPKKHTKKKGGPYLAAALFCEGTTEDKQDSALSVYRIVDQLNVFLGPETPADFPSEDQRIPIAINALLAFRTGDVPGEHKVRLVLESPSGKIKPENISEQTVVFTPQPHGGANLRLKSTIGVVKGGLFLLHVYLDGKRMTTMPLQISVIRATATQDSQSTSTN